MISLKEEMNETSSILGRIIRSFGSGMRWRRIVRISACRNLGNEHHANANAHTNANANANAHTNAHTNAYTDTDRRFSRRLLRADAGNQIPQIQWI